MYIVPAFFGEYNNDFEAEYDISNSRKLRIWL
jgi:hypothetical protein